MKSNNWPIFVDKILFFAQLDPSTKRPMIFKKHTDDLFISLNNPKTRGVKGSDILNLLSSDEDDEELVIILARKANVKREIEDEKKKN